MFIFHLDFYPSIEFILFYSGATHVPEDFYRDIIEKENVNLCSARFSGDFNCSFPGKFIKGFFPDLKSSAVYSIACISLSI
jgi:hypothetical protein